jgi:hypothetical protein
MISLIGAAVDGQLFATAPFHVSSADGVADLVVETDAPRLLISASKSRGVRVHWAGVHSA